VFGVCRHDAGGGTGCHNLIYFESITQKVLISPFFFLYFLKDGRAPDVCWCKYCAGVSFNSGRVASREREKAVRKRKGIKVLDFPGCVEYILV
jgi:hypothetical protein